MKRGGMFLRSLLAAVTIPLVSGLAGTAAADTIINPPVSGTAAAADNAAPSATPPAVLRWSNGESIAGEPVAASETDLTWQTPLFADPLLLGWSALHRIDWSSPDSAPDGTFSFVLRDGSQVYGDLTGLTPETVSLHSALHGDVVLRRAEVLSARRIKGGRLVYAGPMSGSGWKPVASIDPAGVKKEISETIGNVATRQTGPGGTLVLPFWNRTFFLGLAMPDRLDVEFHLHSREQPAFRLALANSAKEMLHIETWGDQLVLAAANTFTEIRQLSPADRDVALRVCWDGMTHLCQVYTAEGVLIKEWMVPKEKGGPNPGVLLDNRGAELTMEDLRVRTWDGQPLRAADVSQPRVELDDGQVVMGNAREMEEGTVSVPGLDLGPEARFPLDQIDALDFARVEPAPRPDHSTLTFTDGTLLMGQIAGIRDGNAWLKTSFTAAPLPAKTASLRQVLIHVATPTQTAPAPALQTLDKIVVGQTTLHGQLVTATGDAWPRWLPVGGERSSRPAQTLASEIVRADLPGSVVPGSTSLFYTRLGDVLPGTLHGLDRTEVEFRSPIAALRSLPADELQAIQFNVSPGEKLEGFDGPGWRILKGAAADLHRTPGTLNLTADSAIGHPAALQSGEVTFSFDTTQFASLRLRMFCDGSNPAGGLSYLLWRSGNQMYTGVEAVEGQFSSQASTQVSSGPVTVRLVIDDKGFQCFLDKMLADTVSFSSRKRTGGGLILEPASIWGNPAADIALSHFTAVPARGQTYLQEINADAKTQALTVPRFRKEDPPRQTLLAFNGDVLPGEIEGVTQSQLGFRLGLESVRVPLARVAAIIALQKPEDAPPKPAEPDAIHKLLDRSVDQLMWTASFNQFISMIQQKVPELKFKLPTIRDRVVRQYQFTGQTAGEALDDLCERFGYHYRLDQDTVVIEAGAPQTPPEMMRKVYWLKARNLGSQGSAREILAAKGIPFPDGAGAILSPDGMQLEMTNTAANQAKLVDVLDRELGGSAGSPTYWLLLTDGGRIGLAVDKFEADAISGTHPLYGHCSVPVSEVYEIRNTMPGPSAAERTLTDWRLAYAPEPVLPQAGGDDSGLLGKEAPVFKLKMLGGGDFDLAQEKGHVVVLDFWATWCGPCINALPGLIEAMAQFPADRVRLVGLDQAEPPEQVKRFVETRGWKLAVALDAGQNVGRQYGVDAIPHTVIIGPDGKVAWVKTGYNADGEAEAVEVVKKMLTARAAPPPGRALDVRVLETDDAASAR